MNANGQVTILGDSDAVTGAMGSVINLDGNGDVSGAYPGSTINIDGRNDVVYGTGLKVVIAKGLASAIIHGDNNQIVAGASTALQIDGTSNVVTLNGPDVQLSASAASSVSVIAAAANVVANLASLQVLAAAGRLPSIILTDIGLPALSLTAVQFAAAGGVLARVSGPYTVRLTGVLAANAMSLAGLSHVASIAAKDTAANVIANLSSLQAVAASGKLLSVALTNPGSPALGLTAAQFVDASGVLARISGSYTVSLTGVPAANGTSAASLGHVTAFGVQDTVAHVVANLASLKGLAAAGKLTTVDFIDSPRFTITLAAKLLNAAALQTIQALETTSTNSATIRLQPGLQLTLNIRAGGSVTIIGSYDSDVINLGSGNSIIHVGSAQETVHGGSGNDVYYVTAATIGAQLQGGNGSNVLHVQGGGKVVMGPQISRIQKVYLDNALPSYNFIANATTGLQIQAGATTSVITVGAATQSVVGGSGNLTVRASAVNAGAAVYGGSGQTTLEITTAGPVTLNKADVHLTGQLDVSTTLTLNAMTFITATGAITGHDTIFAGAQHQTLKSIGGHDILVGYTGFGDTFLGTAAGLAGDSIVNFGGNDTIDISDLKFSTIKPVSYSPNTGYLTVNDATHGVTVAIGGGYKSTDFTVSSDGHNGTVIGLKS